MWENQPNKREANKLKLASPDRENQTHTGEEIASRKLGQQ
jgi:hypothetical protein